MSLRGADVLSSFDFSRGDFLRLFDRADALRNELEREEVVQGGEGSVLATVFFEPSTRTRLSFANAMTRLGGEVIDFGALSGTSVAKGESLADTVRMLDGYGVDIIVLRHEMEGSARWAAQVAEAPVVNGGDGSREHPTQALLDLYTMWREFGEVSGSKVAIVGDLRYGRTPSSLAYGLSLFDGVEVYFVAPELLRVRAEVTERVKDSLSFTETDSMEEVLPAVDVLYVTRIQRERFPDPEEYEKIRGAYQVGPATVEEMKEDAIVMHPLPRTNELSEEVDDTSRARYFEQAANGLFVRMALISEILGLDGGDLTV